MVFDKRLRDGVRRGEITCSIRIWMHPHVKAGGRYPMEEGEIEVDSIKPITLDEITPELLRESGFPDLPSLLKIARHGRGNNVYLVRFHFLSRPRKRRAKTRSVSKAILAAALIAQLVPLSPNLSAQRSKTPGHGFVGSWRLRRAERIDGSAPVAIPGPQGLMIFDAAGHELEIVTRTGRKPFAANPPTPDEALAAFNTFAGFWGSYQASEKTKTITYHPEGAVNPSLMGRDLTRGYELDGDRLVITSQPGESNIEGTLRWTWQRVPPIENLSAEYRKILGFWLWVRDKTINPSTGETINEAKRAPSVIVYAPSGYVGVHFVPSNRKPLAGPMATPEEAQADIAGYIGYLAVLTLHPGWVVHHTLFTLFPSGYGSLDRAYELAGDEVHLTLPSFNTQTQPRQTLVTLKRLSGEKEMFGKE